MKVLIDVPNWLYNAMLEHREPIYSQSLGEAVRDGIPLNSLEKPNKWIPAEVLDKIRAEIEQAADKQFQIAMGVSDLNERYAHIQMENAYRHSLSVIDKYKASPTGAERSKE